MRKLVGLPLVDVGGVGHGARSICHHLDSQVHLEPGEPHDLFALLHSLGIDFGIFGFDSIGVNANLIAKLAASNKRVYGSVIHFSCNVPESHFDGADSAALAGMPSKLLDLPKNPVKL